MDSDLQDPPESIPELISMWEKGNKVVYVIRDSNSNKLMHRLLSPIYYKLLRVLSFIPIPNNAGEFRIIDRVVVNFLNSLTEQTRFLRGLTIWPGFKSSELFIVRPKRLHGDTNYSLTSSLSVAIDGVVGFSNKPIRVVTFIGFLISFLSFVLIIFYLCLWLYMRELFAPGWISLFLGILLMGGLNLLAIGIIGEYVGRSYEELQNRPLYLTADEIGFD
jgi:dolichol-phosphate mannosyltransferase